MQRLHVMVGLPRSGKSTKSKELGFPIVESDAVRKAIGSYPFIKEREKEVWDYIEVMVLALFHAGHKDVILDSTNLTKRERKSWQSLGYPITFYVLDTDKETCKQRAIDTNQEYLIPVIEEMSKNIELEDV